MTRVFAPDLALLDWSVAHRSGWATRAANVVMAAGTTTLPQGFVALVAAGYVVARRRWVLAATVVLSSLAVVVACGVLKQFIRTATPRRSRAGRSRGEGYSMPSSIDAFTAAVAVAIFLAASWTSTALKYTAGALLLIGLAVAGLCMVYLGAHWVSDIIAGWLLGAVVAWGCHLEVQHLWRVRSAHPGTGGPGERPSLG